MIDQDLLQTVNADLYQIFHDFLILQLDGNPRIIVWIIFAEGCIEWDDDHSSKDCTGSVLHPGDLVGTEDQLHKRLVEEQGITLVFCLQHVAGHNLLEVGNGLAP